ncbi:WD and tetratricopeptide repeats protein 1-like [Teleopsis dalmanni]|uniref:WD and tetratricopeptide repeats protein 1 n=1 Tax=Teleopsis dalmanni TaxID=139649 RepID=UPI0018CF1364|nr:WD and tetratricopeptide repeats protein 1 [Teleopsis dalmanni]XP_037951795.1 WD and tetratricopeptide repeats protein 1-like [Teleopsis dalmanni]XP_037951796.1 WD and tetratricopeptide repeats protein 1-like [Teleopsis dalmanni]
MSNLKSFNTEKYNVASLIQDREYGSTDWLMQRKHQFSSAFINRLEKIALLKGHEGCVNCLEWSHNSRFLASGSDDFKVIIWDAFKSVAVLNIKTKHCGNMFSVKFLPQQNDSIVATGAADKFIYVFDINNHTEPILSCNCHMARVKRLATAPDSPKVFWSAGEDGAILQLDLRERHRCQTSDSSNHLINLGTYIDANAEAKCLAINPLRTEFLAVGANDPYARIYDRRMIRFLSSTSTGTGIYNIPINCVSYYCPGHIQKNNSKFIDHESRAITYLTYNALGTELLVNMGGDHIYIYDLLNAEAPIFLNLPEYVSSDMDMDINYSSDSNCRNCSTTNYSKRRKLPEHIETYKKMGNELLENEKYLQAINRYTDAIAKAPNSSVLYLNRATAYMRRLWYGDVYAALRDCHQALSLDPSYIKAHFRLARALLELGRPQEAEECVRELIHRFPSYANNHGVLMLSKDINEMQQTTQSHQQATEGYNLLELSENEFLWRNKAKDYKTRFVGHCNTTTDIKEANYLGKDGKFIVAGSDDGNFFIWERNTGNIQAIYKADRAIVNCVQPHPEICLLATSGIEHDIKLWGPIETTSEGPSQIVSNIDKCVEENQKKMRTDPFDLNTRNALCWNG